MHLTLCMITKGDEELLSLQNALQSIIEHVDEVCITTNSKKITNTTAYLETLPKVKHSHLDWNDDFGAQRNFNFSQASEKSDYILWADSDDVIVNGHLIREIAKKAKKQGFDAVFFEYWYSCRFNGEPSEETLDSVEIHQYRERLIDPRRMVWKKRIHETPIPLDGENFKYTTVQHTKETPVAWLHLGSDRDATAEYLNARMNRNKRLLELELADERKIGKPDPRTILYLMKIYAEDSDTKTLESCIELGYEYVSMSGWDEERAVAYRLMAQCYGKLNSNKKVEEVLYKAIKEFPYDPITYLYLARVCFNQRKFREMKHWLDVALKLDVDKKSSSMTNIIELKSLTVELLYYYHAYVEKDSKKAYEYAAKLYELIPSSNNKRNLEDRYDVMELDKACGGIHSYLQYLVDTQQETLVSKAIRSLPGYIQQLPFARYYKNKYSAPKVWASDEICYYASFGQPHFEKWDGDSLKQGIGGSETAVIRLSEEWVNLGYRVTVYCDCKQDVTINGVNYVSYTAFNPRDKFNIFIQWRSSHLAKRISAKKFLVDLHDVFHENSHTDKLNQIDALMVKSKFHAEYAPNIPSNKIEVISNGI